MKRAARAIIVEDGKFLIMQRIKYGAEYFTLVGGRVNEGENIEQALVREIKEETGLNIVRARLVYIEEHPEPYNQQYIYLCEIGPHAPISLQDTSEEAFMNKLEANIHKPMWIDVRTFARLHFRTPQLHAAILQALQDGFPAEPVKL